MTRFRLWMGAAAVLGMMLAVVGPANPAAAAVGSCWDTSKNGIAMHVCDAEQWLTAGNSWYFGNARMTMQTDGNLVIYDRRNGAAKWSTKTHGTTANRMMFDFHRNLSVYDDRVSDYAKWEVLYNGECGNGYGLVMALQADSNFVLYCWKGSSYTPFWATGTVF